MKSDNLKTLAEFKDEHLGKPGTPDRDQYEEEYAAFKLGFLLREARIEKGMTQEELAQKVGTSKSYISKIENNLKEVRFSTLQKIVHRGLGGELDLKIIL
jgi:DNA-binding XRE family transcriptional regulator